MPFIPHTAQDTEEMLKVIGVKNLDDLFTYIKPDMRPKSFNVPEGKSEHEVISWFEEVMSKNVCGTTSFLGGGAYNHSVPKAVDAIISRGEFLTSYTPYQAEASQGTLQCIFEYQTSVCRLFDMEVANASVYDGGSAIFEACMMAVRATRKETLIIDEGINPIYRVMLDTLLANFGFNIITVPINGTAASIDDLKAKLNEDVAAVVVQNPSFLGGLKDYTELANAAHKVKALLVMSVSPVMSAVIKSPGEMGADIVVADGQSIGMPISYGGPYLGIMATRQKLVRQMPGRIVGKTKDADGDPGYVLTLQAREQHIRRAKATSNICSNQNLCAVRTVVHLALLGPEGLERTANLSMQRARECADALTKIKGVSLAFNEPYGYEFAINLPKPAAEVVGAMADKGALAGIPVSKWYDGLDNTLLVACTETTTPEQIDTLAKTLAEIL